MKIIFISAILILCNLFAFSQQKTFNYFSNSYLTTANHLNSLTSIANYRKQISIPAIVSDLITENNAIYKLAYKPTTTSQSIPALIDISVNTNDDIIQTFEESFGMYFSFIIVDEDENTYIKEIVKAPGIEGGYVFRKSSGIISLLIEPTSKNHLVQATIYVKNLTDAQQKAFAKDFILKTVYK